MDGRCRQDLCPFEHKLDMSTLWKLQDKFETENKRTTKKTRGYTRKNTTNNVNINAIDTTTKNAVPKIEDKIEEDGLTSINESPTSREIYLQGKSHVKCDQFPRCFIPNCEFAHPHKPCKWRPLGLCKSGRYCGYLHETCPSDGDCKDVDCEAEHFQQRHPAQMAAASFYDEVNHKMMARHRLQETFDVQLSAFAALPNGVDLNNDCIVHDYLVYT